MKKENSFLHTQAGYYSHNKMAPRRKKIPSSKPNIDHHSRNSTTMAENSEEMTNQAWSGLRRMGQPVMMGTLAAKCIIEANRRYAGQYFGLVVPALAWPLVGATIASSINAVVEDWEQSMNNYIYYTSIGTLAAVATASSIGTQYFFERINEGMLKDVFNGTLVCTDKEDKFAMGLTLGLCTMVGFHTLYASLQKHIYAFAFRRSKL